MLYWLFHMLKFNIILGKMAYSCHSSSYGGIRLEIKQSSEGSHHIPGIVEAKVDNIKQVWQVLQAGSNARAVGSNNVNEHSSRSHW